MSRYGQFKLLEKVAVYDRPGYVQSVPGGKEDVFKSKALSLMDKRRLMRFLMFAAGDFEGKKELEGREQMPFMQFLREVFTLNDKVAGPIAYALAFCMSAEGSCHAIGDKYAIVTHAPLRRAYVAGHAENTAVPTLRRTIRHIALPRWTLRWAW